MVHFALATVLAGAAFTRSPLLRPPDPGLRAGVAFERTPHLLPPLQCRRAHLVGAEASAAPDDVVVEAWIARSAAVVVAALSGRMGAARPLVTLLRWLAFLSFVAVAPVSFLICGVTAVVLILSGAAGYFPFNVVTGTLGMRRARTPYRPAGCSGARIAAGATCIFTLLYKCIIWWGRIFQPRGVAEEEEGTGEERDTGLLAFVIAALTAAIKGALPG